MRNVTIVARSRLYILATALQPSLSLLSVDVWAEPHCYQLRLIFISTLL